MNRSHVATVWFLFTSLVVTGWAAAQSPVLTLHTKDRRVAREIAAFLPNEGDDSLPEWAEGERVVLELDAQHRQVFRVELQPEGAPIIDLSARPGPLKKAIKQRLGWLSGQTRATIFSLFVLQYKAEPRWVARAMKGVTDFPFQMESLRLVVRARKDGHAGEEIELDLQPRPGTWMARVIAGLQRSDKGAHLLRTPDAAMSVAAAVEGKSIGLLMEPFATYIARLRGANRAERREFLAHTARCVEQFDGSYSLLVDGPGRYVRLVGLADAKRYGDLKHSPTGKRYSHRRLGRPDVVVANSRPSALDGSSMQVLLKEQDPFELVTAPAKAELHTFAGVVGDFSVKARLPKSGQEAAKLSQRIQRRWLRRIPLPRDALALAEFNLSATRLTDSRYTKQVTRALRTIISPSDLRRAIEALPKHLQLSAHKTKTNDLQLKITTRR